MPKIVLELRHDAISESCSLGELLRKALVVAKKLHITDFELWASHELNGYPPGTEIPQYREVVGTIKVLDAHRGCWIPFIIQGPYADAASRRRINEAVGSLEALVSDQERGNFSLPFPPEIEARLMREMDFPTQLMLQFGSSQIHGILQAIRNTILHWALDLESRGILGDDMSFTSEEQQAAKKMQTVNIEYFQGILGDVKHSTVTQNLNMDVRKGDFDSLAAYLRSVEVEEAQIADLKERIKQDPVPQGKDKLGPKVSSWIGEMVGKAASGGWQLAVGTAGSLLFQLRAAYTTDSSDRTRAAGRRLVRSIMPHPERAEGPPWLRMFQNAREWCKE
ncbi:MAG: hypothetical protein CDV28_10319 [Candidatus Electronema aureum]|uniref:AbiTii domain-containing protein n=1 Tax=Candidatus Electronema aureum TaxID=2005002 RepID=A0A521G439_9BACT|nr:MAG: hypothetical protein CDV28_10319 [Candidatus Electronema aureum]